MTSTQAADGAVVAPVAPGRLGSPLDPPAALAYLTELGRWCDARHHELQELDRTVLESPDPAALTDDVALALAVWKSVADRYQALVNVWDSGRAGAADRERMASLIWGRLDTTVDPSLLGQAGSRSGLAVSLPEACRLSDALAAALRARLAWSGSAAEVGDRVRSLRAQLERIREQVALEPAGARQHEASAGAARLARRLQELADKAGRGGDVGGQLGPLEIDATRYERDLIVQGAQRRESAARVRQARTLRADLERRATALRALAADCVAAVSPAPKYAVPDVAALGPVPNTAAALEAYLARLQPVSRAMTVAAEAYSRALRDHDDLQARLEALAVKAAALGPVPSEDLSRAYALAVDLVNRRPAMMLAARAAVDLYAILVGLGPAPTRAEETP